MNIVYFIYRFLTVSTHTDWDSIVIPIQLCTIDGSRKRFNYIYPISFVAKNPFPKIEDSPASERDHLKRTALEQYTSLVNELDAYEQKNYEKFLAKGMKVVNTILKRNIIKLEPCHSDAGNIICDYYQFVAH